MTCLSALVSFIILLLSLMNKQPTGSEAQLS